jgi:hypothetical protein
MSPDRLDLVERDVRDHSRILTEHNGALKDQKTSIDKLERDKAVREVEDTHLDERLDRIEKSIGAIYRLGWWILGAFGAAAISLVANFMFRGGFIVS